LSTTAIKMHVMFVDVYRHLCLFMRKDILSTNIIFYIHFGQLFWLQVFWLQRLADTA